jgi:hypothetical protein
MITEQEKEHQQETLSLEIFQAKIIYAFVFSPTCVL